VFPGHISQLQYILILYKEFSESRMSSNVLGIHEASYYLHLGKFRECRVM
jgi:hypothetical protein